MDGGAWWAAVHGVAKSRTRLSDFTFTFHFHALEKEMATHSSVLAWRIPGMGEPGGLPSMGSHRVGHDWSDLAAAAAWFFKNHRKRYYEFGEGVSQKGVVSILKWEFRNKWQRIQTSMKFLQTVGCWEVQVETKLWGKWHACSHNPHCISPFL